MRPRPACYPPAIALPGATISIVPSDTHPDARAIQVAIVRKMTGSQRSALAARMSDDVRDTTRAAIRARHPGYDTADVERALRRLLLGDELVHRAWPAEPLRDP